MPKGLRIQRLKLFAIVVIPNDEFDWLRSSYCLCYTASVEYESYITKVPGRQSTIGPLGTAMLPSGGQTVSQPSNVALH